ncbi:hypothetical protein CP10139811_0803 [Chlamydia ibidis]|uniref:SUF system FeS cluster assembly SufBD core domain-containing protein n=2 Tax=Chlamydia ibidis TaxID=1405396 RepID=S7KEX6_9CHLA|nr:SufD family Fe-S cluster assembly protein [Chlamydia ibidis]EPP34721.1 hypothetical protein CP10139811_0803 [Chlamydia ibidis]EQM62958.1 hypothetical protein H359_0123 [Chlamydia ibidis 10-1398/6]
MLAFLEHCYSVTPGSPIHEAARDCYLEHSKNQSFRDVFRSFSWIQGIVETPNEYHIACGGSETVKQHWLHRENSFGFECVLINGKYEPSLSQLPDGVVFLPLNQARSMFSTFLHSFSVHTHPLAFLNAVCAKDEGVVIYVPEYMQVSEPLCVRHVSLPISEDEHVVYSPKIVVIMGREASAEINVYHHTELDRGSTYSQAIVNGVTELFIAEKAELSLTMFPKYISEEKFSWTHVVTVEENGSCCVIQNLLESVQGYGWFDNIFSMVGKGAYAESLVAALSTRKTWVRNLMDHDAEATTSRQDIKSILNSGEFIFEGGIRITSQGIFSCAEQNHRTLLLCDEARVSTFPRLEILADDVKASHGATVGPLDPKQVFYMRSRGMTKEEAQKKLVQGFLSVQPSAEAFPKLIAMKESHKCHSDFPHA